MTRFDENQKFYTVKEVASILRVDKITIYWYIHSKRLHAIQLGRSYRISSAALAQFMEENAT